MSGQQSVPIGSVRVDPTQKCLWRGQEKLHLKSKAFDVLSYLMRHSGQLVTKRELFTALWPETFVGDAVLTVNIGEIREVLGDDFKKPEFIETVHRKGFRFIGTILEDGCTIVVNNRPLPNNRIDVPNLVGRHTELTQLYGWWEKALAGERQLVFITGEPGIGKTALVEAFLAQLDEHQHELRIGWGQCIEQHGAGEAFLPVLKALGRLASGAGGAQLIEVLRTQAPMWLVQLPAFINGQELEVLQRQVQRASRERMLRELAEALEVLTAAEPLILCFEDLHWSDVSTIDLMASLARGKEDARLMLIGTYRPVEMLSDRHPLKTVTQELYAHQLATELSLGLLSEADIAAYLEKRVSVIANGSAEEESHLEPQRADEESLGTSNETREASTSPLSITTPRQPSASGAAVACHELARTLHQHTDGNPLFLVSIIDFEFYQRGSQSGQSSEMLGGCLDHPIHPSL